MVKRFSRRRPRVVRRRYRRYGRRINRPVRQQRRFFKIREVQYITATPTQDKIIALTDDPHTGNNWQSLATVFDSYRCCAMKIRYFPLSNVNEIASAALTVWNTPIWLVHDKNSVYSGTGISLVENDFIQYQNFKSRSLLKTWSAYFKMQRNQPPSSATEPTSTSKNCYMSTNTPLPTQTVMMYFPAITQQGTANFNIARIIVTYYLVFKHVI